MATVSDLIHSSFRLIGAIAAGETLETSELNDAFVSLNQIISLWNTEGLSLAGRQRVIIPVTQTNNYALATRPIKIESADFSTMGINSPLEIVDAVGWSAVTEQGALAIYVKKLYCDYLFPNSTVYLWPIPRTNGNLEMWQYAAMDPFTDVSQTINLPPGYEAALRYNFAMNLLPEYPRSQPDPTLAAQAQSFKASLVQLNASNFARTEAPTPLTRAAQGEQ